MRIALDTNILVYAEGLNGVPMQEAALKVTTSLPVDETFLPVQTLGELFRILVRKGGRSAARAEASILAWRDTFPVVDTTSNVLNGAIELAKDHRFQIWDAVVLSASADAGCRLLLTEDLHEGFTWRGVTVSNPFARPRHPLLESLLKPLSH